MIQQFKYESDSQYLKVYNTDDEKFTFFWETKSPFSQWHPSKFELDDIVFLSAEHYMMYQKAMFFQATEIANKILVTKIPREVKALGRSIENFDSKKWEQVAHVIVYAGNMMKFKHNPKLMDKLLETKGTTLVEASPYDTIWGIGLMADHQDAAIRENWKGTNLLGRVLTQLRFDLTGKY